MDTYAIIAIAYVIGIFGVASIMASSESATRRENVRLRRENDRMRDQIENIRKWTEDDDA